MRNCLRTYSLGICICLFCISSLRAQINPETAFYWENPYSINPASVNLDYSAFFSLAARKQWASFPGSPVTFWATGAFYLEDYRTQAGMKVLKDKIGYLNTFDISLSYAYTLRLSWNSFLNMGVAGSWQSQNIDRKEVEFENPNDPVLGSERMRGLKEWNANIGAEYVFDKKLVVGMASQNLFSFFKREPHIWGGTNYAYARYRTRSVERSIDMEYGLCAKQYEEDFQLDGMVSLYLNRDRREEMMQFSIYGRSVGEVGFLVGMKLISELKFLCAYDYNFKAVSGETSGSFEVMITYPIHRNSMCRSEWDR